MGIDDTYCCIVDPSCLLHTPRLPLNYKMRFWANISQVDSAYVLDLDDADIALLPKGEKVTGTGDTVYLDATPYRGTDRTNSSFRLTDIIGVFLTAIVC